MKPWKLCIDWTQPDDVEVELHVMDAAPRPLRRFGDAMAAVIWAQGYMRDRGAEPAVVNLPIEDPGYIYLHARPKIAAARPGS